MSDFGWGTCYSCHPDGLHDGVTWMFPRRPAPVDLDGEHRRASAAAQLAAQRQRRARCCPSFKQRVLNWSAVRDEIQDFELNIRAVSGGQGLIRDGQAVVNLVPTANTGRDADLDAIAAYIAFGIRAPISPLRPRTSAAAADPDDRRGAGALRGGELPALPRRPQLDAQPRGLHAAPDSARRSRPASSPGS